ncbi:MAG: transcription elongation factor GreAB [Proteobacteria bacterium]|nr:transcription elongation factor GreAB [Pseudomonadota bacterium]
MEIDKAALIALILEGLNERLDALCQSARAAYDSATHEESKAEDKYDTRGLEASYLAGAQAKRTKELEDAIGRYTALKPRPFGEEDPIALSALITVDTGKKEYIYFIGPEAGGMQFSLDGAVITVITPRSPLGKELVGRYLDDEFELTRGDALCTYEIVGLA